MNNKILNIAQIGVGYWGPNLLRNLVLNNHCVVKMAVDTSAERRNFVKKLYPTINVSDNANDAIHDQNIDAIVIATPVSSHFNLAMQTLNSGKHLLIEKPMATTVAHVNQIGRLALKNKLVVMAGHTFLYNPAVRFVKKLIDSGELGKIRYIYSQRVNLGRIRSDVNALWNLAPHDISIIQYWLNDAAPKKVTRSGMAYVQDDVDDVVFMNIQYSNDILINIHVSWLDPHKVRRMTIVGSEKMVVYDDLAENKVTIYDKGIDRMAVLGEHMDFDNMKIFNFSHRSGDVVFPKIKWEEPLKVEIEHFVDCILNGTACLTGTDHAKKVVSILEAGSRSTV